jgi:alpha-1,3-rhamnosyl/mannosyltransferase
VVNGGHIHVGIDATTWWNPRGYGRFTRELLKALAARQGIGGFRYSLLIDRLPDASLPTAFDVIAHPTGRTVNEAAVGDGARSPRAMLLLSRAAAQARFDLFWFPTVYSFFPLTRPVPCVVTHHDVIAERNPKLTFPTRRNHLFWLAKVELAKRQAQRIMTVSEASAADLSTVLHIDRGRIDVVTEGPHEAFRVLPDGVQRGRAARARHGLPPEGPLIVHVGGLSPHKNLLGLLKVMLRVLETQPSLRLALVGDTSGKGFHDNLAELRRFVADNAPLSERVVFTGFIPDDDVAAICHASSALVFPSFDEGFGLPAVEAMACGLPVIASRIPALIEVAAEAGVFFDPHSPDEMARAIVKVIADEPLRTRLGAAALSRAWRFTWARGAELAEQSFRRCWEERPWWSRLVRGAAKAA